MSLNIYLETTDSNQHESIRKAVVYNANITHNLATMADEAGIYMHIWRPTKIGIKKAAQLIEPLRAGLTLLKNDRARFEQYNAKNGWGVYVNLVQFVEKYLVACEEYPDADVFAYG